MTEKKKAGYIGAPACFKLEIACKVINDAFGGHGCYVVGSAIERPDWRDVDVRMILTDAGFEALFPDALLNGSWEFDARWTLMTTAISGWLKEQTGLPIDFQFQPQSWANARHNKPRHPVGLKMISRRGSAGRAANEP